MLSKDTAVGFIARLDASSSNEPEPAPKRAPGAEPSFLRRTLAAQDAANGILLARSCLLGKSSVAADVQLLLDEALTARRGPVRNYAFGRLVGYIGELDHALGAAREAGLKFDFPPLDEVALLAKLEGR